MAVTRQFSVQIDSGPFLLVKTKSIVAGGHQEVSNERNTRYPTRLHPGLKIEFSFVVRVYEEECSSFNRIVLPFANAFKSFDADARLFDFE